MNREQTRSLLFFIENVAGSSEGIILSKERNKLHEMKFLLISLRYNVCSLLIVKLRIFIIMENLEVERCRDIKNIWKYLV